MRNNVKNEKKYKICTKKYKIYKRITNIQKDNNYIMQNILQILDMQGGSPPARWRPKFVECST